jgi:hypothetical protein
MSEATEKGAAAPGQASVVPDVYARYLLAAFPDELGDFAQHEAAMRWEHLTGEREREFWRSLSVAPPPARDDAGTVRHVPTNATWVTWDDGLQPPWHLIDEAVSRLTGGAVKVRACRRDEDEPGRLAVAVYRDLPELEGK